MKQREGIRLVLRSFPASFPTVLGKKKEKKEEEEEKSWKVCRRPSDSDVWVASCWEGGVRSLSGVAEGADSQRPEVG